MFSLYWLWRVNCLHQKVSCIIVPPKFVTHRKWVDGWLSKKIYEFSSVKSWNSRFSNSYLSINSGVIVKKQNTTPICSNKAQFSIKGSLLFVAYKPLEQTLRATNCYSATVVLLRTTSLRVYVTDDALRRPLAFEPGVIVRLINFYLVVYGVYF